MPNPQEQSPDQGLSAQEEYDLEQSEAIAAAGGKAPAPVAASATPSVEALATAVAEAEASRKGWLPKDKFKGDTAKWVDAKTFVERGERFNANLIQEVATLKQKIASFEGTKEAFAKFHAESMAKKDSEIADAIKLLRLQHAEAVSGGEGETALTLEDRIDALKDERKALKEATPEPVAAPKPAPAAPAVDPVMEEWIEDGNAWFRDDTKLQSYAVAMGQELVAKGETLRGRKFLDKIATLMAEEFPRKFNGAGHGRAAAVESGGRSAATSGSAKSERDLPAADRRLMNEFVEAGWTTKEAFLKSYFTRNGA